MIILGTNSIKDTGYNVDNSARFDGTTAYLNRTPGSASNRKTFTFSTWIKRSGIAGVTVHQDIFSSDAGDDESYIHFDTDSLKIFSTLPSSAGAAAGDPACVLITNQKFRDFSAWYHIVVAVDTTQGTASNRVKLYINGTQVTSFSTETYPDQNYQFATNAAVAHMIARRPAGGKFLPGYLAETVLVDGSQLAPDQFGEFDEDSGIWKPIDVSGLTFGTNGFYLDFENSGSLGADVSGNGNNFTVNNLTAIDQSASTCTNNEATLNPLNVPTSNAPTFAEGNLFGESVTGGTSSSAFGGSSTFGLTKGKWYLEAKCGSTGNRDSIGVTGEASTSARTNKSGGTLTNSSYFYQGESGVVFVNTVSTGSFSTFTNNDIIGIALDLDNNKLYFRKNAEAWGNSGDPTSGATGTGAISLASISSTTDGAYFISNGSTAGGGAASAKSVFSYNFGSPPYAISSGNTDGNGYGNFEYAVPSGYYSLNTKNLAEYG